MSTGADTKAGAPSAQVLRALNMLERLAGELPRGLTNKDLAEALRCPPSYVTRTADVLVEKGWVEKDEATGRFRLTTRFSRLGVHVMTAFDRAEQDLAQIRRNYTLPQ